MHNRFLLAAMCLLFFVCAACVPINQHMAVKNQLKDSRLDADLARQRIKELEVEFDRADDKIARLSTELKSAQQTTNTCSNDLNKLRAQNDYLKNINLQLSQNVDSLKTDIDKKKSVIELQEKVIGLLDDTKKTIEKSLKDEIASQDVEIVEMEDKLKVIFVDKILFDSGQVDINEQGKTLLLVIADSIRGHDNQDVVVEGHTDDVPLSAGLRKRFPSNWELSTARAAAVARFLQEEGAIKPERLSARGYSYYRPVASNDTEEGRRQNRRIEIILGE